MIEQLKFVQGAIKKRGSEIELSHFRIHNRTIQGYNGSLALSTPIDFDVNCTPKAEPFINAITKCTEQIILTLTPAGKLSIKSGKFKAFIPCLDHAIKLDPITGEGNVFEINGVELLNAFKAVIPFVADNANHAWANGVYVTHQSVFATNNNIIVENFISVPFPIACNIPRNAIKEIIRINEPPTHAQSDGTSITFYFDNLKFIKAQLLAPDWPDVLKVLNNVSENMQTVHPQFFNALSALNKFTDSASRVYFKNGKVTTSILDDDGAVFDLDGFNYTGCYKLEQLALLKGNADTVDFSMFPKPALFYGQNIRGVIVGMRE